MNTSNVHFKGTGNFHSVLCHCVFSHAVWRKCWHWPTWPQITPQPGSPLLHQLLTYTPDHLDNTPAVSSVKTNLDPRSSTKQLSMDKWTTNSSFLQLFNKTYFLVPRRANTHWRILKLLCKQYLYVGLIYPYYIWWIGFSFKVGNQTSHKQQMELKISIVWEIVVVKILISCDLVIQTTVLLQFTNFTFSKTFVFIKIAKYIIDAPWYRLRIFDTILMEYSLF